MAITDKKGGFVFPGYDPLQVPNPPTNVAATAVSASVVTFSAPSVVGGGAITSYVASATPASGATVSVSGSASPLTFSGLVVGTVYTVQVTAFNTFGPSAPSTGVSITPLVVGQAAYTSAGSYTWVAPTGVTSVSVVCVGGGGNSASGGDCAGSGGGGLAYGNNITVVPSTSYTVIAGVGYTGGGQQTGGTSSFINTSTLRANGGTGGSYQSYPNPGGDFGGSLLTAGQDGGAGGSGGGGGNGMGGGGGAGGYSGGGGAGGGNGSGGDSSGGGAGGGAGGYSGGGGGGVGILGEGSSGSGGIRSGTTANGGGGGSGGTAGQSSTTTTEGRGGPYGGGSGGYGLGSGVGAVRIIWPGTSRSFPSTGTGDQ